MKRMFTVAALGIALISGTSALSAAQGTEPDNDLARLGMHIYKDKNISYYGNQSCQSCHSPIAGFADRSNLLNPYDSVVSVGSDGESLGVRNAPSSAYAGYSPILTKINGEYFGGLFWDGRADGSLLGDPLAEQAQGPPLNPVEMAMESFQEVLNIIKISSYYDLWLQVFQEDISEFPDQDDWDNFAQAVAAYERSNQVSQFSSKYDLAHNKFSHKEQKGEALFKTHCASCHATTVDGTYINNEVPPAPLFTTFGYANIGVPANPLLNLDSADLGLGAVVDDSTQYGKFKIPTLRNIAVTAPYAHNGFFPTLTEMVSFINDSSPFSPEVSSNLISNDVVGDLGLSAQDIEALVAFLETLTDGY